MAEISVIPPAGGEAIQLGLVQMRIPMTNGRAYAAAIPGAGFQLLKDTGHLPQLETPQQLMHEIWRSVGNGTIRA